MPAKPPRKAGDELLLSRGPQTRAELLAVMMPKVQLGQATRAAAKTRKPGNEDDPRRGDEVVVGQRLVATKAFAIAKRCGAWIEEDGLIRHRDWVDGFAVPTSADINAHRSASLLERFAKASGWERAALVAAFVEAREGQGKRTSVNVDGSRFLSATEFARLGIKGLTSHNTVLHHLDAWLNVAGRARPQPGDVIADMPDIPFPKRAQSTGKSFAGAVAELQRIVTSGGATTQDLTELIAELTAARDRMEREALATPTGSAVAYLSDRRIS